MRERIQRRERRVASVIENLLKLRGRFCPKLEGYVGLAAQVLRPELGGGLVPRRRLQLIERLRGITTTQLHRRADSRRPDRVDRGVFRIMFDQFVNEQLGLIRLVTQRQTKRGARERGPTARQLQALRRIGSCPPAISERCAPQRLLCRILPGYFFCIATSGQVNRAS